MLKSKSDMSPVSAATFNVSVAGTMAPAWSVVLSLFHVKNRLDDGGWWIPIFGSHA